jgi:hypothetical protein
MSKTVYCESHASTSAWSGADNFGSKYCYQCAESRRASYRATSADRPLTRGEATAYLAIDSGDAPASPYGTRARNWQPVALIVAEISAYESGEGISTDSLDHAASLVVNGSEDVAWLITERGPSYGINPTDYLTNEQISRAYLESAGENAHLPNYLAAAIIDHIREGINADTLYRDTLTALELALETALGLEDIEHLDNLAESFADIIAGGLSRAAIRTAANMAKQEREDKS